MGYRTTHKTDVESLIDEEYGGMWMLRGPLGCEHLGVSIVELEPGGKGMRHDHAGDGHEEVYLVVEGELDVDLDGDETVTLGVDEAIHVPPRQSRQLVNRGDERVKVVAVGAGRR
jgi:mannose-6-phosphate isomerase-like protein (cupin superfamily)